MAAEKKVLFFVTEDWYFYSHRLSLALALLKAGYDVSLLTNVNKHQKQISQLGIRVIPIALKRESFNPLREMLTVLSVLKVYRAEKPDIVHHVALKPILYGAVAAILSRVGKRISAFAGLGSLFAQKKTIISSAVQALLFMIFRFILRSSSSYVIFQNPEDKQLFESMRIIDQKQSVLIRGAGVDTSRFCCFDESDGEISILFGSRMLWDKGVAELIEAARQLREKKVAFRMVFAGIPDPGNPNSIQPEQLQAWHDQGVIEWLGYQKDMASLFAGTHVAVLPSYREGVPKFLIEAAACGRPIVTTDVPGCREIVQHGKNGFLVPLRNSEQLADGLLRLIQDAELRKKMGAEGRKMVTASFSEKVVVSQMLEFYKKIWN